MTVDEQLDIAKNGKERLEKDIKLFQDLNNMVRTDLYKGSVKVFVESLKKDTLDDLKEEFMVDATGKKVRVEGEELQIRQAIHNRILALIDPLERPELYLKDRLNKRDGIDKSMKILTEYKNKEADKEAGKAE